MKKSLAVAVCAVLAMSAMGCSSGEIHGGNAQEPTKQEAPASSEIEQQESEADDAADQQVEEAPESLIVSESGCSSDDIGHVYYAAIIENPNTAWAAEDISINFAIKDDAGNIIGSEDGYITLLFASGKTAVCGYTMDMEGAVSVDVSVQVPKSNWTMIPDVTQGDVDSVMYADSVNISQGEFDTSVTGIVHNDTDSEVSGTRVNVVVRDDSGAIVGGNVDYVDTLTPQSTSSFSVDFDKGIAFSKAEAYLDLGYIME